MSLRIAIGILLATAIASTPALACKGRNVLFEDAFREVDPAWDSEGATIDNGRAQVKADAGRIRTSFYNGSFFEDADICLDVVMPQSGGPGSAGGLAFWGMNYSNVYFFMVEPGGNAMVFRMQNGKWLTPVSSRKAEGARTQAGQSNTLRLTLKGLTATAYVNDRPFISFKGQPPQGGGLIGLHGEGENNKEVVWSFGNLKVSNVP